MANLQTTQNFEPMYAALRELGLTENEQRLYVASWSLGPGSIGVLATHLGLPRPNLYKIIDGLAQKGLVDKTSRLRYSKNFTVEAPSKISELLRERREKQSIVDHAFIDNLPSYVSHFRQGEGPLKVKVLVGQKDFQKIYDQMYAEAKGEIWFFGSITDLAKAIGRDFIVKNAFRRIAKGIGGKGIFVPSDRNFFSQKENVEQAREVRYLPEAYPFVASFHVFSNKIVFYQPKTPMAVLIEDEYIVAMMKSMFLGLWEKAGKD